MQMNAFINSALEAGDAINTLGNTVNADAAAGGQALSYPFPAPSQVQFTSAAILVLKENVLEERLLCYV